MIRNIALLNFVTHSVHVSRNDDSGELILFKYNKEICDFTVAQNDDEASDWILAPLPLIHYQVTFPGEE